MYQEHFGFKRRPFGAVPDIGLFVENDSNRSCLDAATLCLESGQGITILTAPSGLGKTILCHKMAAALTTPFVTVLLANSNFATQRAMLQSFLFELGRKYVRLEEQELRLELISALRGYAARDEKVVLIVDEAEHLKSEILEEVRNLANLSDKGQPLLRVVLAGQPQLEERLLEPDMTALNQRIRSQLYLQPLTRGESVDYIADQIQICGQISELVIQDDAMDLLVHAADGNPRCLNQLADHSLLLAYMSGERPVSYKSVREALDDLKRLPLQWNDPGTLAAGNDLVDDDLEDDFAEDDFLVDEDISAESSIDNELEQRLSRQFAGSGSEDKYSADQHSEHDAHADPFEDDAHDDSDDVISFEIGGQSSPQVAATPEVYSSDESPSPQPQSNSTAPVVDSFQSVGDDDTAVFEVGASVPQSAVPQSFVSQTPESDSVVSDAAVQMPEHILETVDCEPDTSLTVDAREDGRLDTVEDSEDDDGDIIELPVDEDSYVAYESTAKPQGIASSFVDADEFTDTYKLELPPETGESELDIPLVPLGSSMFETPTVNGSHDVGDDESPLSLVDRLSEDDRLLQDDDADDAEAAVLTDDHAAFADQPVGGSKPDAYEEVVFDRYAWLDAGGNPNDLESQESTARVGVDSENVQGEVEQSAMDESVDQPIVDQPVAEQIVASIHDEDVGEEDAEDESGEFDVIMADPPSAELEPSIAVSLVGDLDSDLDADLLDEEREMLGLSIEEEVYDIVHPPGHEPGESTESYPEEGVTSVAMSSSVMDASDAELSDDNDDDSGSTEHREDAADDDQSYANLFSRLRRLQLAARDLDDRP